MCYYYIKDIVVDNKGWFIMINNKVKKKKYNLFTGNNFVAILILLPVLIAIFCIIYFSIKKNIEYVYNNDNSFAIHCYSNNMILNEKNWNIVDKVNIKDKIVCNISYELSYNLLKLSYKLDYGNSLKVTNIGSYWGNSSDLDARLDIDKDLYTYSYTREVSFDDSPNITFEVINDDVRELFIAVRDIKYETDNGEYLTESDVYYSLDIMKDNNYDYLEYGEKLDTASLIYRMKNHTLPTFNILDNIVKKEYTCDSRVVNHDASVYLKNCDINGELLSHGQEEKNKSNTFIYVYKNKDSYYITKEKKYDSSNYSLADYYVCDTSFCEGIIENDLIVISDLELMYKKIGTDDEYASVYAKKEYDIKVFDKKNLFIRYYEIENMPIYVYFLYDENKLLSNQYLEYDANNSLRFNLLDYNLSFNTNTLDNGYILIDNYTNDKRNIYIYDFINSKVVYDITSTDLNNQPKFTKDIYYAIYDDEISYQKILYLDDNMNILYDGIVYKDENYYIFNNGNILFKRDNEYYIYSNNGKLVKKIFEDVSPNYIEVDNDRVYGIVYQSNDNYYRIYDENSNNTFTSRKFNYIYDIYQSHGKIYILVNENGFLRMYDKDQNLIISFIEMTDNLEFSYNYYGDIWIRDKNIPDGKQGSYILCYYDFNSDTLYISRKDYDGGY